MPDIAHDRAGASPPESLSATRSWRDHAAVAWAFLRIGATAFGGPAAAMALMRDDMVERRGWLSEQQFLDMLGATNLSPGPAASKLAMYIGQARSGGVGLLAAGLAFMAPAVAITLALAWAYVRYETTPTAGWLLYGIKPVIVPLVLLALWNLGHRAIRTRVTAIIGGGVCLLSLLGINLFVLLAGGGLLALGASSAGEVRRWARRWALLPLPLGGVSLAAAASGFSLGALFLFFLKVGATLFGSGYVLFAFLHDDLVTTRGWLTEHQLVDAIAVGQMKPGPLSTSATFIGYLLGGWSGALVATVGIYLPTFLIVALSGAFIPRVRQSVWASHLLDGVNAAALGLMAAVTWTLARAAFVDAYTGFCGGVAALLVFRFKVNGVALVIIGAGLGLLSALL